MPRLPITSIAAARTPALTLPKEYRDDPWLDFKPELMEVDAIVIDNNIDSSDPVLNVRARGGRNWTIELADRARHAEIGLKTSAALPFERIHVIGRRTRIFGEYRIKALRLIIGDRIFDLYPDAF